MNLTAKIRKLKKLKEGGRVSYSHCPVRKITDAGILVWELRGPNGDDLVEWADIDWTAFVYHRPYPINF